MYFVSLIISNFNLVVLPMSSCLLQVTALPVNGGTYNLILNTSTKKTAAVVSCLSILSYVATAIVSGFDAIVYLSSIWSGANIQILTVVLILLFMAISLTGVKESSAVSATIFLLHMTIMAILIIWAFIYGIQDNFETFHANLSSPLPDVVSSSGSVLAHRSVIGALFYGYCSALLGITGFESAANYVEEMESPAIFVSTVNWLW